VAEGGSKWREGSSDVLGKGQMISVSEPAPRPSKLQRPSSEGGFAGNDARSGVVSHEKREADCLRLPGSRCSVCACVCVQEWMILVVSRELVVFFSFDITHLLIFS